MGFFRSIYREAREIIGMKPPAENELQRADRVCREVADQLGGKRGKRDGGYTLSTAFNERGCTIDFDAMTSNASVVLELKFSPDFTWTVSTDPKEGAEAVPRGFVREYVGTGIYVEGPSRDDVNDAQTRWKEIPTGGRGLISQLLQQTFGELEYDEGVITFTPGVETLADKSAKYKIRDGVKRLDQIAEALEAGWR